MRSFHCTSMLKLDQQRRLRLPVRFRKVLGKENSHLFMQPTAKCLKVYPMEQWSHRAEPFPPAVELIMDSYGRICIPATMHKIFFAESNNVIVTGMWNYFEIWPETTFATTRKRELLNQNFDELLSHIQKNSCR